MTGKISVGVRVAASGPKMTIMIAMTMKVDGPLQGDADKPGHGAFNCKRSRLDYITSMALPITSALLRVFLGTGF